MTTENKSAECQKISWKYCECGCKGYGVRFGPVYFWMFNDLGKGKNKQGYHLFPSHMGTIFERIDTYDSFKEADEAARNIAREKLKTFREELDKAEAGL